MKEVISANGGGGGTGGTVKGKRPSTRTARGKVGITKRRNTTAVGARSRKSVDADIKRLQNFKGSKKAYDKLYANVKRRLPKG